MKDFVYEKIPKVYFGKGVLEKNLPNELKNLYISKFLLPCCHCKILRILQLQTARNYEILNIQLEFKNKKGRIFYGKN